MIYRNKFLNYVYQIFTHTQKKMNFSVLITIRKMIGYGDATKENINKHDPN